LLLLWEALLVDPKAWSVLPRAQPHTIQGIRHFVLQRVLSKVLFAPRLPPPSGPSNPDPAAEFDSPDECEYQAGPDTAPVKHPAVLYGHAHSGARP
jgi:hypothetical protein